MTKLCRTCNEPVTDQKKCCRNGCTPYTAMPVGTLYSNNFSVEKAQDGQVIETGGAAGNIRRMPTNRE